LAFPSIVANELGIPCHNYALTGGSNARSLRKLIHAVQEFPNSLVLFGWTCLDRNEFYYPDSGSYLGRDDDNYIQVGMQWFGKIQTALESSIITHPINDVFVNELLRPVNNLQETKFIVDSICKLNAADYLHIPLFPETVPASEYKVIDFQGHGNYLDWCKAKQFEQLPFLHYNQDAHNALAELILGNL
jgi:hypothetical protein